MNLIENTVREYFAPLLSGFRKPPPVRIVGVVAIGIISLTLPLALPPDTYRTAVGGLRQVKLEDGSAIDLNTATALRVHFKRDRRYVELIRGEALFAVASDRTRPFDVKARNVIVHAKGTRFTVRLNESSTVVTVDEGTIQLNPPSTQDYSAGTIAQVDKDGRVHAITVATGDLDNRLAWTTGRLVFTMQPLSEVVAEINRYNTRQIVLADPTIGNMPIGGTFTATDPESFLKNLESVLALKYRVSSDTFVIERRD